MYIYIYILYIYNLNDRRGWRLLRAQKVCAGCQG